ncbi:MAG TPA: ABC transporter permease, partial [Acidimicrobiia bacterium]|nr:ABC transporter permease [Acidimicrobiia bacterium]
MTATEAPRLPPVRAIPFLGWRRRPWRLVERNTLAYRRMWYIFLSGLAEPILFLLSIGIGVGKLVGDIHVGGVTVTYSQFVAPGLLAVAAMNGSLLDTTFNFFVKMKYQHVYDAVLATPLAPRDVATGEITWALLRGAVYSAAFLITMVFFGDVLSWWAILGLPAAV